MWLSSGFTLKSGEIVACRVEEGGENRMVARSLFHLSLIQCMSPGFHTGHSFPFSPQYASFHSFIPPYVIFPYLFVLVPVPYSPCCCQFPDGRTWVVSPFRQRKKSRSSLPVSEKCVRWYWSLSRYEYRWVLSTLPLVYRNVITVLRGNKVFGSFVWFIHATMSSLLIAEKMKCGRTTDCFFDGLC